jgi:hypothetical protein
MTASKTIFYSHSPYGTGDIKTGTPNISVTSGVATITTAQTGNIGAGCAVAYNSLTSYIAPNRIGYDSGSNEIKPYDQVEGQTSGAKGIVQAVTLSSGTWAGGDAAGKLYFRTTEGTFQDNENLDIVKPDDNDATNAATTDGTIEGNIGNGNTQFVLLQKDGTDAANQTSTSLTSISHEWASGSAAENGWQDANHLNTTDLTSVDTSLHICAYYDHDDGTKDTTEFSWNIDTFSDADRFTNWIAPPGGEMSINAQQSNDAVWTSASSAYMITGTISVVQSRYERMYMDGIQIEDTTTGAATGGALNIRPNVSGLIHFYINCKVKHVNGGTGDIDGGFFCDGANGNNKTIYFINCIAIDVRGSTNDGAGFYTDDSDYGIVCRNCLAFGCTNGYYPNQASATINAKNSIANSCTTGFNTGVGTVTTTYCCTDIASEISGTGDRAGTNGDVTFVEHEGVVRGALGERIAEQAVGLGVVQESL